MGVLSSNAAWGCFRVTSSPVPAPVCLSIRRDAWPLAADIHVSQRSPPLLPRAEQRHSEPKKTCYSYTPSLFFELWQRCGSCPPSPPLNDATQGCILPCTLVSGPHAKPSSIKNPIVFFKGFLVYLPVLTSVPPAAPVGFPRGSPAAQGAQSPISKRDPCLHGDGV